MIHIITGEQSAEQLRQAFLLDENLHGEIFVLNDYLHVGEILSTPEIAHKNIREYFWKNILSEEETIPNDVETIQNCIYKANMEEEPVCFWVAPSARDICNYYFLLTCFRPYVGMLHTIQIAGLPFLNEKNQLFIPNTFAEIPPKEFTKTKRLLKEVSAAEYELDIDEWNKIMNENAPLRIYEGGKKIVSKDINYINKGILSALSTDNKKINRLLNDFAKKSTWEIPTAFVKKRLITLAHQGDIFCNNATQEKDMEFSLLKQDQENSDVTN